MSFGYRRYRFIPHTKKTTCPRCGSKKRFTPYIDVTTNLPVDASRFGRCDRENNCRYHEEPPKGYFDNTGGDTVAEELVDKKVVQILNEENDIYHSEINVMELIDSITENQGKISLFKWLCNFYPEILVRQVFSMYLVGYSKKYYGSPVYWQVDSTGSIRSGKVLGYDSTTGKRVKTPYPQISWIHTVDRKLRDTVESEYILKQCLFGEHLLSKFNSYKVVESEKSVLICTLEDLVKNNGKLEHLWLACGGLTNITNKLFRPLAGEQVVFYPDKGAGYLQWKVKVEGLESDISVNFKVNKGLERTNLEVGEDIADYIIKKKLI